MAIKKITITLRAANDERKHLDKKIKRICDEESFITKYYGKLTENTLIENSSFTVKEVENSISSTWDKLSSLIAEREKYNTAVLSANANTMVTVPAFVILGKKPDSKTVKISLAAANNRKNYYTQLKEALEKMMTKTSKEVNNFHSINKKVQMQVEEQFSNRIANLNANEKTASKLENIRKIIEESSSVSLCDPIKIQDKLKISIDVIDDYLENISNIITHSMEVTNIEI